MKQFSLRDLVDGEIPDPVLYYDNVIDLTPTDPDYVLDDKTRDYLIGLQTKVVPEEGSEEELDEGYKIHCPQHFGLYPSITSTKTRLNKIVSAHREATGNPEAGSNLVAMLGQYMDVFTKDLQEEQTKEITQQIESLLLDIIEENPNHITWLDQIGREYTQACENRTAFGFIEMASCLAILQEKSTTDKTNSARVLPIMDRVAGFFNKHNASSESGEIETGILLLVGVENRFLVEGVNNKWSGIPPYLSEIQENYSLKEELVDAFYDGCVAGEMKKSDQEVQEYLCNTRFDFWSLCFSNQVEKIEESHVGKIELVKKMINRESCSEEEKVVFDKDLSEEDKKTIDSLIPKTEEGKKLLKENPLGFWSEKLEDLGLKKNIEIAQTVLGLRELVFEGGSPRSSALRKNSARSNDASFVSQVGGGEKDQKPLNQQGGGGVGF
ncbi:MAG: hypothetical protein ACJA0S_000902 [Rickettsiales bacterium]|jgi:hypothetical protein